MIHVNFLDFSNAFNTVSHRMVLDKMSNPQLDKHIVRWVNNWSPTHESSAKGYSDWDDSRLVVTRVPQRSILDGARAL